MPIRKTIFVAAFAAIAVLGVTTPGATAAGWMVNGTELSGPASLATTAAKVRDPKLVFSSVTIECAGETINSVSPQLESPNRGTLKVLEFTGCDAVGKNCQLAGTKVATVPLSLEATLEGFANVGIKFVPKSAGTLLATIAFEGSKCDLAEEIQPLKGSFKGHLEVGQAETVTQELVVSVPESSGELKVGSTNALMNLAAKLKLASGKAWSLL